jgi:hypothetical protein
MADLNDAQHRLVDATMIRVIKVAHQAGKAAFPAAEQSAAITASLICMEAAAMICATLATGHEPETQRGAREVLLQRVGDFYDSSLEALKVIHEAG